MGESIASEGKGDYMYVEGRVLSTDGKPIADAVIETWETDGTGELGTPDAALWRELTVMVTRYLRYAVQRPRAPGLQRPPAHWAGRVVRLPCSGPRALPDSWRRECELSTLTHRVC